MILISHNQSSNAVFEKLVTWFLNHEIKKRKNWDCLEWCLIQNPFWVSEGFGPCFIFYNRLFSCLKWRLIQVSFISFYMSLKNVMWISWNHCFISFCFYKSLSAWSFSISLSGSFGYIWFYMMFRYIGSQICFLYIVLLEWPRWFGYRLLND